MIPRLVKVPVSLAQQFAAGLIHVGISGATSLLHRVRPGGESDGREPAPSPDVDSAPAEPPVRSESATRPATAKKAPATRTSRPKSAATLNEPAAPIEDDPVVYSSGPEVSSSLPTDDLEAIRTEL